MEFKTPNMTSDLVPYKASKADTARVIDTNANFACKASVNLNKYSEFSFLERIMTFIKCMYPDKPASGIDLFCAFMRSVKTDGFIKFINSENFYFTIIRYFCSRFITTTITHLPVELYCLPIAVSTLMKPNFLLPSYYIYFDKANIASLVISTFKMYYLHDGNNIIVELMNDEKNDDAKIDSEYDYWLDYLNPMPFVNNLADGDNTMSKAPSYFLQEDKDGGPGCTMPTPFEMRCPDLERILSNIRPNQKQTIFESIAQHIYNNGHLFLLLTIVLQVLESFQFVNDKPIDKAVDLYIKTTSNTFARSRVTRERC